MLTTLRMLTNHEGVFNVRYAMLTPMRTQIMYICTQKTGKVFKTATKEPLGDHDNQLM